VTTGVDSHGRAGTYADCFRRPDRYCSKPVSCGGSFTPKRSLVRSQYRPPGQRPLPSTEVVFFVALSTGTSTAALSVEGVPWPATRGWTSRLASRQACTTINRRFDAQASAGCVSRSRRAVTRMSGRGHTGSDAYVTKGPSRQERRQRLTKFPGFCRRRARGCVCRP